MTGQQCGHLHIAPGDPVAARLGLGAAALRYAAMAPGAGIILALRPGSKEPAWHRGLQEHGILDATGDQAAIWKLWDGNPARGVGLGNCLPGAFLAADCDVKRGIDGPGNWAAFLAGIGVPPSPVWDRSPSGGWRMWWRLSAPGPKTRNGILPGVDIPIQCAVWPTGVRQAPLARPSEPPPGPGDTLYLTYTWHACPCSAPPAPGALIAAIDALPGGHAASGGPGAGHGSGEPVDLAATKRTGWPVGSRNQEAYRAACSLWRRHGATKPVLAELAEIYAATDKQDLPWSEVLGRAESAQRFIARQEQWERLAMAQWQAYMVSRGA